MEETLTDCLVNMRDDLKELQRIRKYLDSKSQSQTTESCSMTWRTIEVFNSILAICASQDIPDSQALEILLDSFNYIATNNIDKNVWNDFGFELGIISVKILSAIEQTDIFDTLFYKLLTVINTICEYNSDLWKAVARQILNVFINKKFSFSYLEAILKLYICILRNVENTDLYSFAQQNLHLLKTLSMLVQRIGDFETQIDIMELVFLHVMDDKKLIQNFFIDPKNKTSTLLNKLQFSDFEKDCRIFLNELNKNLGTERKVYTISCHKLILGGCSLEPPPEKTSIWMDANKDSKRISIKCADFQSDPDTLFSQCVVYLQFQDIISVKLEYGTMSETSCYCLTFDTKNLDKMFKTVKNNEIVCIALEVENSQDVILEFINFLEDMIKKDDPESKSEKIEERMSQTYDTVCINRDKILKEPQLSSLHELQNNAISSSINDTSRSGIKHIMPDVLKLLDKVKRESNMNTKVIKNKEKTKKELQEHSRYLTSEELLITTPTTNQEIFSSHIVMRKQNQMTEELSPKPNTESVKNTVLQSPIRNEIGEGNIVPESQELTPNSFVESLNKNLGIESQEIKSSFEESIEKLVTTQLTLSSEKKRHKLFKKPDEVFDFLVEADQDVGNSNIYEDSWENKGSEPFREKFKTFPAKVYKPRKVKKTQKPPSKTRSLPERTNSQVGVTDSSYKNCFLEETLTPTTRVLRGRTHSKVGITDSSSEKYFRRKTNGLESKIKPSLPKLNRGNKRKEISDVQVKVDNRVIKKRRRGRPRKLDSRTELELVWTSKKLENEVVTSTTVKPSLLDPDGYAYQRWKMPTTSERSKFWLKKLDSIKNKKSNSTSIFDFSEDSESENKQNKQKKKKVLQGRKKRRNKPRKINFSKTQTPVKEIKNILKTASQTKFNKLLTEENKIKSRLTTNNDNPIQINNTNFVGPVGKTTTKEYNLISEPANKHPKPDSTENDKNEKENPMDLSKTKNKTSTTNYFKNTIGTTSSNITERNTTNTNNTNTSERNPLNHNLLETTNEISNQNNIQNNFNKNNPLRTSTRIDKNLNMSIDDYIEHYTVHEEFNLQNNPNKNEDYNVPAGHSLKMNQAKENTIPKISMENTRYQSNKENTEEDFSRTQNLRNKTKIASKNNFKNQDNINMCNQKNLENMTIENFNQYKPNDSAKPQTEENTKLKTSGKGNNFHSNKENIDFSNTQNKGNKINNISRKNKPESTIYRRVIESSENNITLSDPDDKEPSEKFDKRNTSLKSRIQYDQIAAQNNKDIFNPSTKDSTSKDKISVGTKVNVSIKTAGLKNIIKNNNMRNTIKNTDKGDNQDLWMSVIASSKENIIQSKKGKNIKTQKSLRELIPENTTQDSRILNEKKKRNLTSSPSNEERIHEEVEDLNEIENQISSLEVENYQDIIVKDSWKALKTSHQDDAEEKSESSNSASDKIENNQTTNYDNLICHRSESIESIDEREESNRKEESSHVSKEEDDTNFSEVDYNDSEFNKIEEGKEESELEFSSEDEMIENKSTKKRERSEEESSARIRTKKKTRKTEDYNFETLPMGVRLRLKNFEDKVKKETNEIIEVVDIAANQLYNHIQRKEVGEVKTYLKTAEEVCSNLDETHDLEERAKRVKRAMSYYKAGCSVSGYCGSVNDQFSQIRQSLKGLTDSSKNTSKKIDRFGNRLKNLIDSDIQEKIEKEFLMSKKRLLKLTSSFDI